MRIVRDGIALRRCSQVLREYMPLSDSYVGCSTMESRLWCQRGHVVEQNSCRMLGLRGILPGIWEVRNVEALCRGLENGGKRTLCAMAGMALQMCKQLIGVLIIRSFFGRWAYFRL